MGEIGRRDLMKGAAVAGSLIALPGLAACAGGSPTSPSTTTALSGATLDRLSSLLEGDVVVPSDPGYDAVRVLWNARFDDIHPQAVVEVASTADVATTVRFARENGFELRVRTGGHSFAGYSTSPSLVVDTRRLVGVEVSTDGETARLGAGLTNLQALTGLWQARKAVPGGLCPTVGLAGLAAGGGLGVLGRRYGLTCDSLDAAEVVTADGDVVRASEEENPDLLWATRGGGGGNFGIITSMTFGLVPVDMPFTFATYTFPWAAAVDLLAAWQAWLPEAPRNAWAAVFVQTQDPAKGEPTVALDVVHAGAAEPGEASVADLLDAVGTAPVDTESETTDFLSEEGDFYCKGFQRDECALADASATGRIGRPAMYASSNVAKGPWPAEGLATVVEWIERRQRDPLLTPADFDSGFTVGKLIFEPADGAINDVAPDATAFVHRDALMVMQYQARWRPGSPPGVAEANIDWVSGMYEATAPYRSGSAYQNYIDRRLEGWEQAYYGANLARLRQVKSRFDPENFLNFPQSIPLA